MSENGVFSVLSVSGAEMSGHLCDGSGQASVLLQVGTERVRAVDGGGAFVALHLKSSRSQLMMLTP